LHAQTLHLRELDFRDLQVVATIRDGRLHVDPLKMTGAAGQVNAQFDLLAKGKRVTAQVSGTAKNLHLSPVLVRASGPNDTVYSARVELQGSGTNLREIAATLNGRIRLVGTGGRLANSHLMAGSNEFAKQLLSSLNPLATRQPTTEVECVAYLLSAKDGVVTTDPALVMRTAGLDIISNGSADLRTENIDLSFKIAGRKGIGIGVAQIINPYLKVTGSLGKPAVTLDPTGALVNGGAAFATAGLSVVATTVWDRIFHEKDPCAAAVAHSDRRKWD
jgi:AsmA family protein